MVSRNPRSRLWIDSRRRATRASISRLSTPVSPRDFSEELALELVAGLEGESLGSAQRSAIDFAAANLLDRLGRYDEAFARRATPMR